MDQIVLNKIEQKINEWLSNYLTKIESLEDSKLRSLVPDIMKFKTKEEIINFLLNKYKNEHLIIQKLEKIINKLEYYDIKELIEDLNTDVRILESNCFTQFQIDEYYKFVMNLNRKGDVLEKHTKKGSLH